MKKYSLRGLLALSLVALFALNLFLYRELRKWYRNFNLVRLNPLALGAFPETEARMSEERPLVLFYGDSRAASWPSPDLEEFRFANRGVNGHTSAQSLLRFEAHATPLEPDILMLQVGINDLVGIPLLPGQEKSIVAATKDNIGEIVTRAQAAGTTVILSTIFPTGPVPIYQYPFWSPAFDAAIHDVNQHIRSLAGEGVIILETGCILGDRDGRVQTEFAADFLHLNEQGYAALNRSLSNLLLALSED